MKIGILIIVSAVLLTACTIDPITHYASEIKKAEADGAPILIYGRPKNDRLDFISVSKHPIKEINLELLSCDTISDGAGTLRHVPRGLLVTIKGNFMPGYAYKVHHAKVEAINAQWKVDHSHYYRLTWESSIFAVRVMFADGTSPHIYMKDVASLLIGRINSGCSSVSGGMPADMQFIHS